MTQGTSEALQAPADSTHTSTYIHQGIKNRHYSYFGASFLFRLPSFCLCCKPFGFNTAPPTCVELLRHFPPFHTKACGAVSSTTIRRSGPPSLKPRPGRRPRPATGMFSPARKNIPAIFSQPPAPLRPQRGQQQSPRQSARPGLQPVPRRALNLLCMSI